MPKGRWASIRIPREWVLVVGVCDERRRCRRHCSDVGEGKQNRVDKHEPQLGSIVPGICCSRRPISFFQDHLFLYQGDHYSMERSSCLLECRIDLSSQCQLQLKLTSQWFFILFYFLLIYLSSLPIKDKDNHTSLCC
jgi:hypothetical protein